MVKQCVLLLKRSKKTISNFSNCNRITEIMKHQKLLHLLNEPNDAKFVTVKWYIVNDQLDTNYDIGNEIIYNAEALKYNLCDQNIVYILVRVNITIIGHQVTQVTQKSCAPFSKYITEPDETRKGDAEDLDLVMPIHNLI